MEHNKNQDVDILEEDINGKRVLKVISNQSNSTPGIYYRLKLKPYETYLIQFKAVKKSKGVVKLWIAYNNNRCIEFSDKYRIEYHVTNIEYRLKNGSDKEQTYKVGILFTKVRESDYFILHKHSFSKINTSRYLYLYYYKKGLGHRNAKWQISIRDHCKDYIDTCSFTGINDKLLNMYDVIILDYYCLARYNPVPDRNKYLKMLKESGKKIAVYLNDMHEYTFVLSDESRRNGSQPNIPNDKPGLGVKAFIKLMRDNNINYLISRCDCKELDNILVEGGEHIKGCYLLPHHIDPRETRDYQLDKEHDILIFGATNKSTYPFRARLKNILLRTNFKIKYIPTKGAIYDEELSKELNKSWIAVATKSNFDYLVRKYFEISASKCVVAGNMPSQGRSIWENNFVELDESMTDKQIIEKLKNYLNNKRLLREMMESMYKKMHNNFTYKSLVEKMLLICEKINKSGV